ncbi:hypothetical protein [Pusillimonas noertemannii]|uniref:Uncharacterized protein n=1 Tax=Pusillimonas noertemannii TaxID=305977 RepID=A0A2U1CS76_9BURK|nr:hypothetical protein [Pusillimonas noertemannii]NYT67984.1 hypothetical protein [Pusillimonas noertemannii]PVY68661.1 hypothetical protein C7440_1072 [Pusillimonas noertemannii]TFL11876.1 hypothetical protein CSC72_01730 [Pusillimonas noertemannii]
MTDVTTLPSWRQAAQDLLQEFGYGDLIPLGWLEARFGIPSLSESQRLTAEQFKERQFEWLANVEAFKDHLLKEHQVCLQSVRGKGYRWVPPHEQTALAVREFERDARRVFRQTGNKLRNLRHTELTDEQRRANMDATVKLSALAGMTRKALS